MHDRRISVTKYPYPHPYSFKHRNNYPYPIRIRENCRYPQNIYLRIHIRASLRLGRRRDFEATALRRCMCHLRRAVYRSTGLHGPKEDDDDDDDDDVCEHTSIHDDILSSYHLQISHN